MSSSSGSSHTVRSPSGAWAFAPPSSGMTNNNNAVPTPTRAKIRRTCVIWMYSGGRDVRQATCTPVPNTAIAAMPITRPRLSSPLMMATNDAAPSPYSTAPTHRARCRRGQLTGKCAADQNMPAKPNTMPATSDRVRITCTADCAPGCPRWPKKVATA